MKVLAFFQFAMRPHLKGIMKSIIYSLVFTFLILTPFLSRAELDSMQRLRKIANQLTDHQTEVILKNSLKYVLYATHKTNEEQKKIFRDLHSYITYELNKIYLNQGKKIVKIEMAPRDSLTEEIIYLKTIAKSIERKSTPLLLVVHEISETLFLEGMLELENYINVQFPKIEEVIKDFIESSEFKFKNSATGLVIKQILIDYFLHLELETKKNILSDLIRETQLSQTTSSEYSVEELKEALKVDRNKLLEIAFRNAGPVFQKLAQTFARNPNIDSSIRQLFTAFESNAREVPFHHLVDKIIGEKGVYLSPDLVQKLSKDLYLARKFSAANVNQYIKSPGSAKKGEIVFIQLEAKQLASGSVAQVHKAEIVSEGNTEKVIVRFVKPNTRERLEADYRIMRSLDVDLSAFGNFDKVGDSNIKSAIESIYHMIIGDLNLVGANKSQITARAEYIGTKVIRQKDSSVRQITMYVPKVFKTVARDPGIQIHEFIKGESYTDLLENKSYIGDIGIKEATRQWMQEAFVKTGFFHADIHNGNMFFHFDPKSRKLKVIFIDFGQVGLIDSKEKMAFISLIAGAQSNNVDLLANSLYEMLENTEHIHRNELKKMVAEEIRKMGKIAMVGKWITWIATQGPNFNLKYKFTGLGRSLAGFDNLLKTAGSKQKIHSLLGMELLKAMGRSVIGQGRFPVDKWELTKVIAKAMGSRISYGLSKSCRGMWNQLSAFKSGASKK